MRKGILLLLLLAITTIINEVYAVKAHPQPRRYTQPNGEIITIKIKGDEHCNWVTTTDDYRIAVNKEGYFVYISNLKSSEPLPSNIIAHDVDKRSSSEQKYLSTIKKEVGVKELIANKKNSNLKSKTLKASSAYFPTSGPRKNILILANFNNKTETFTQANILSMMNATNYGDIGSFKDYYIENSSGNLTITTDVTVWVTVPKSHDYYGDPSKWAEFAYDAIKAADSQVDFSQYEKNGSNLYGVTIIHQGLGQETSGNSNDIWSHQGELASYKLNPLDRTFDGVVINSYSMQPEMFDFTGKMASLGVMVHEFGHLLGVPDFYDTDYSSSGGLYAGTGDWDLMSGGAYNGSYNILNPTLQEGACPAHMNPLLKIHLGWASEQEIDLPQTITLNPIQSNPIVYKIPTSTSKEFFYVENRTQTGFDKALPGKGMLIYHVDSSWIESHNYNNDINVSSHQGLYIKSASGGYTNTAGCPFPGAGGITSITDITSPNLKSWSNNYTNKSITNITEIANDVITFDFMALQNGSPLKFSAESFIDTEINLKWSLSSNNDPIMVAFATTPTFGDPENGVSYNNGDPLPNGGGTVLYNGLNTTFVHTSLTPNTTYYYKIWSKIGVNYSTPLTSIAKTNTTIKNFPWSEPITQALPDWTHQWIAGSNTLWNYQNGAYYGIPSAVDKLDPDTIILAIAQTQEGYNISQLISPTFVTTASTHQLSFKHAQPAYFTDQDTLRVLYKLRSSNTWSTLASFATNIPNWRYADIDLPISTEPFQLAFQASIFNGNGIYIDSLSIQATPTLTPINHTITVTSNSTPLANASVCVVGDTVTTNSLGVAIISANPSRNWEIVKIWKEGYETKIIKRYASSSITETIDILPIKAIAPSNFKITKDYKSITLSWNPVIDESFEQYEPWGAPTIGGWSLVDLDNGYAGGYGAFDYPNSGIKSSFVVFDGSFGGINSYFEPHSGTQMAVSFFSRNAPNNDWMISPQITIENGDYIELFARTANDEWGLEEMRVLVSENTSNTSDFVTLHPSATLEVPTTWTNYNYDLSAYAGKTVYLAINCVSNDKYALLVDDVTLKNVYKSYTPLSALTQNHTSTPETSGNIEYQILRDGTIIKTLNGFENNQYTNETNLCKDYEYSILT